MNLKRKIFKIGEKLVREKCYTTYPDLEWNPKKGIIPRGIVFEDKRYLGKGSVIVGMNPGRAKLAEREFIKSKNNSYEGALEYWNKNLASHQYYKQLRQLVDHLGLSGPILWTELVKCQSKKNKLLSVATTRDDIHRYLFKELQLIPKNWPLIAVGKKAYEILSYSFPDRLVIGIPHVTGSFGHFKRLFKKGKLKQETRKKILAIIKKADPITIYLN